MKPFRIGSNTDVRIGTANRICTVTTSKGKNLDVLFGNVDGELKNLANKIVDMYSEEVANKISKRINRTMAAVPCGLPVMPPHWVFTVNIWTYEVIGEYEAFIIIDNDNEVISIPYFGHKGQRYVREYSEIYDPINTDEFGYYVKLGDNKKINFKFNGYATSIVGPGQFKWSPSGTPQSWICYFYSRSWTKGSWRQELWSH